MSLIYRIYNKNLILFCITLFICCSCLKNQEDILVRIDDKMITLSNFKKKYKHFLKDQFQEDNLMNRFLYLNNLIDEELILKYAKFNRLEEDTLISKKKQEIYDQLLLNCYFDEKINIDFHITEKETRDLFKWQNTSVHVRHLFSKDRDEIKYFKSRLNSGEEWESIAKECFQDPILKSNAGDLGWYKLGELDPIFELNAFALNPGEISVPIKTRDGYSIIHLIEIEMDGFLLENEYLIRKDKLIELAKYYKQKVKLMEFTDNAVLSLNIDFDEKSLENLYQFFINEQMSIEPFYKDKLVTYKGGTWSVIQCIENLANLSLNQLSKIESPTHLKEAIMGLISRNKFLVDAKNNGLDQSKSFEEDFNKKIDQFLISHIIKTISFNTQIDSIFDQEKFRKNYFNFRNQLASKSNIEIDSLVLKSFIM